MVIEFTEIVKWVMMGGGLVSVWFRNQYNVERLNEKYEEMARQVESMWKWKDTHEKESVMMREKFNGEISELRGSLLVTNEQFKQIVTILNEIKERLLHLENKVNNKGDNK